MISENKIIEYCKTHSEFTPAEIEEHFSASSEEAKKHIHDTLEHLLLVFNDKNSDRLSKYYSRHSVFNQIKFRIILSDYEIKNKVLIPGHRFIPFYYYDLLPCNFKIYDTSTRTQFPLKKISFTISSLYDYFYMFSSDTIADSIAHEDDSNSAVIGKNPKGKVLINVFDLAPLLTKKSKTNKFNSIVIHAENYTEGVFNASIEYDDKPEESEDTFIFIEELESALYKVFEKFGPYMDVNEQLAWAYFSGNRKALSNPIISIEEAVALCNNIELKFFEQSIILWYKNDDTQSWQRNHGTISSDLFSLTSANTSSIDTIFDELHFPFSSKELSLFMTVPNQYESAQDLISDTMPSSITWKDRGQEVIMLNLIEDMFDSFQSQNKNKNRKKTHKISVIIEGAERLKTISKSYHSEKINRNRSKDEAHLAYRTIKDQIESLSSIFNYYMNNPDSLDSLEPMTDLEDYIEQHFRIISEIYSDN